MNPDPLPGLSDEKLEELVDQQENLPLWDGNFALSSQVVCQRAADYVPQRATDNPQNVEDSVDFFCDQYDGHIVRRASAADDPYTLRTVSEEVGFWIRAEYRGGLELGAPIRADCRGEVKINGHECARLLKEAMGRCDTFVGESHGHLVKGSCIDYVSISPFNKFTHGKFLHYTRDHHLLGPGSCTID